MANKSNLGPKWLEGVVDGGRSVKTTRQEAPQQLKQGGRDLWVWQFENDGSGLMRIPEDEANPDYPPQIAVFIDPKTNFYDLVRALHKVIDDINELPF